MADRMAGGAQGERQLAHQREGVAEGREVGDLAADVHVDAGDGDAGQLGGLGVEARGVLEGHAELVLGLAGGDLGVRLGVDIGVDAEGDRRGAAEARRDLAQRLELRLRFHVEAEDALLQRIGHLGARLADAGEDDLVGGDAGGAGAAQLALRHHVHAGPEARQRGDDGLVGIGLDGVADQRVETGEGLLQHAVVPLQGRRRVAIEGGADLLGHRSRGSRPPRGGRRRHSRSGACQRISGSRMEGLCGTGWPGVPGTASPVSAFSCGGASSEPRTPQPTRPNAPSAKQRSRQPKPQTAVHSSPVLCPLHSPQHQTASETANRFKADTALSSPFRRPFPTALSRLAPFCAHSVARFPHSWSGSAPSSRPTARRKPRS